MKSICDRIDAHSHVKSSRLVENPSFPDAIKIEITSRCNYKCEFCSVHKSSRNKGDIDRDFLHRILDEAKEIGVKEIGFFLLGEPFLVPELPEYIRYAKKIGIEYVFLTTNGYLCCPEKLIAVIDAGLDSLKFSVNSGTRESYRKLHGVDGFDKVIEHIKFISTYRHMTESKIRTCVSAVFNPENAAELESLREMISPYVDEFYYLPLYNQAGAVGGKEFTKVVGNPGRLANMARATPCWELFNTAKITWDGKMTACCFDHENDFIVGDLHEMPLIDAWNSERFMTLRKQHLTGRLKYSPCKKCLGLL